MHLFSYSLPMQRICKRIVASITLLCFVVSQHVLVASDSHADTSVRQEADSLSQEMRIIPDYLGMVTGSFQGKEKGSVIILQDLHCHEEAQLNISRMLHLLQQYSLINCVALEGARGPLDVTLFRSFPEKNRRKEICRFFIKLGVLSGGEQFAIEDSAGIPVYGVEDRTMYARNIEIFKDTLSFRNEGQLFAVELRDVLTTRADKIFPPRLARIFTLISEEKNESSFLNSIKDLVLYAQLNGYDTQQFPNCMLLIQSEEIKKTLNADAIETERLKYIDTIAGNADEKVTKELLQYSLSYRLGKISSLEYFEHLLLLTTPEELTMMHYVNLFNYVEYLRIIARIQSDKLTREKETLQDLLFLDSARSAEQVLFYRVFEFLKLMEKLYSLGFTNHELRKYLKEKETLSHKVIDTFFGQLNMPASVQTQSKLLTLFDAGHISLLEEFYSLVQKRDLALFNNILSIRNKQRYKHIAFVSGGFHSEGIASLLREEGISYVILTPKIAQAVSDDLYVRVMKNEPSFFEELIRFDAHKFAKSFFSAQKSVLTPEIRLALDPITNNDLRKYLEQRGLGLYELSLIWDLREKRGKQIVEELSQQMQKLKVNISDYITSAYSSLSAEEQAEKITEATKSYDEFLKNFHIKIPIREKQNIYLSVEIYGKPYVILLTGNARLPSVFETFFPGTEEVFSNQLRIGICPYQKFIDWNFENELDITSEKYPELSQELLDPEIREQAVYLYRKYGNSLWITLLFIHLSSLVPDSLQEVIEIEQMYTLPSEDEVSQEIQRIINQESSLDDILEQIKRYRLKLRIAWGINTFRMIKNDSPLQNSNLERIFLQAVYRLALKRVKDFPDENALVLKGLQDTPLSLISLTVITEEKQSELQRRLESEFMYIADAVGINRERLSLSVETPEMIAVEPEDTFFILTGTKRIIKAFQQRMLAQYASGRETFMNSIEQLSEDDFSFSISEDFRVEDFLTHLRKFIVQLQFIAVQEHPELRYINDYKKILLHLRDLQYISPDEYEEFNEILTFIVRFARAAHLVKGSRIISIDGYTFKDVANFMNYHPTELRLLINDYFTRIKEIEAGILRRVFLLNRAYEYLADNPHDYDGLVDVILKNYISLDLQNPYIALFALYKAIPAGMSIKRELMYLFSNRDLFSTFDQEELLRSLKVKAAAYVGFDYLKKDNYAPLRKMLLKLGVITPGSLAKKEDDVIVIADAHSDFRKVGNILLNTNADKYIFLGDMLGGKEANLEFAQQILGEGGLIDQGTALAVLGNHEIVFLEVIEGKGYFFDEWKRKYNGNQILKEAGFSEDASLEEIRSSEQLLRIARLLREKGQLFYINRDVLFVHSGITSVPYKTLSGDRIEGFDALKALQNDLRNGTLAYHRVLDTFFMTDTLDWHENYFERLLKLFKVDRVVSGHVHVSDCRRRFDNRYVGIGADFREGGNGGYLKMDDNGISYTRMGGNTTLIHIKQGRHPFFGVDNADTGKEKVKKMLIETNGDMFLGMLDVEWIQQLNNVYGRETVDLLLKEMAQIADRFVRDRNGVFYHLQKDKFCVAVPYLSQEKAQAFFDELTKRLRMSLYYYFGYAETNLVSLFAEEPAYLPLIIDVIEDHPDVVKVLKKRYIEPFSLVFRLTDKDSRHDNTVGEKLQQIVAEINETLLEQYQFTLDAQVSRINNGFLPWRGATGGAVNIKNALRHIGGEQLSSLLASGEGLEKLYQTALNLSLNMLKYTREREVGSALVGWVPEIAPDKEPLDTGIISREREAELRHLVRRGEISTKIPEEDQDLDPHFLHRSAFEKVFQIDRDGLRDQQEGMLIQLSFSYQFPYEPGKVKTLSDIAALYGESGIDDVVKCLMAGVALHDHNLSSGKIILSRDTDDKLFLYIGSRAGKPDFAKISRFLRLLQKTMNRFLSPNVRIHGISAGALPVTAQRSEDLTDYLISLQDVLRIDSTRLFEQKMYTENVVRLFTSKTMDEELQKVRTQLRHQALLNFSQLKALNALTVTYLTLITGNNYFLNPYIHDAIPGLEATIAGPEYRLLAIFRTALETNRIHPGDLSIFALNNKDRGVISPREASRAVNPYTKKVRDSILKIIRRRESKMRELKMPMARYLPDPRKSFSRPWANLEKGWAQLLLMKKITRTQIEWALDVIDNYGITPGLISNILLKAKQETGKMAKDGKKSLLLSVERIYAEYNLKRYKDPLVGLRLLILYLSPGTPLYTVLSGILNDVYREKFLPAFIPEDQPEKVIDNEIVSFLEYGIDEKLGKKRIRIRGQEVSAQEAALLYQAMRLGYNRLSTWRIQRTRSFTKNFFSFLKKRIRALKHTLEKPSVLFVLTFVILSPLFVWYYLSQGDLPNVKGSTDILEVVFGSSIFWLFGSVQGEFSEELTQQIAILGDASVAPTEHARVLAMITPEDRKYLSSVLVHFIESDYATHDNRIRAFDLLADNYENLDDNELERSYILRCWRSWMTDRDFSFVRHILDRMQQTDHPMEAFLLVALDKTGNLSSDLQEKIVTAAVRAVPIWKKISSVVSDKAYGRELAKILTGLKDEVLFSKEITDVQKKLFMRDVDELFMSIVALIGFFNSESINLLAKAAVNKKHSYLSRRASMEALTEVRTDKVRSIWIGLLENEAILDKDRVLEFLAGFEDESLLELFESYFLDPKEPAVFRAAFSGLHRLLKDRVSWVGFLIQSYEKNTDARQRLFILWFLYLIAMNTPLEKQVSERIQYWITEESDFLLSGSLMEIAYRFGTSISDKDLPPYLLDFAKAWPEYVQNCQDKLGHYPIRTMEWSTLQKLKKEGKLSGKEEQLLIRLLILQALSLFVPHDNPDLVELLLEREEAEQLFSERLFDENPDAWNRIELDTVLFSLGPAYVALGIPAELFLPQEENFFDGLLSKHLIGIEDAHVFTPFLAGGQFHGVKPVIKTQKGMVPIISELDSLIQNHDAAQRKRIMRVFTTAHPYAEDQLLAYIEKYDNLQIVRNCCLALGRMKSRRAVKPLTKLLLHEDELVSSAAIDALFMIDQAQTFTILNQNEGKINGILPFLNIEAKRAAHIGEFSYFYYPRGVMTVSLNSLQEQLQDYWSSFGEIAAMPEIFDSQDIDLSILEANILMLLSFSFMNAALTGKEPCLGFPHEIPDAEILLLIESFMQRGLISIDWNQGVLSLTGLKPRIDHTLNLSMPDTMPLASFLGRAHAHLLDALKSEQSLARQIEMSQSTSWQNFLRRIGEITKMKSAAIGKQLDVIPLMPRDLLNVETQRSREIGAMLSKWLYETDLKIAFAHDVSGLMMRKGKTLYVSSRFLDPAVSLPPESLLRILAEHEGRHNPDIVGNTYSLEEEVFAFLGDLSIWIGLSNEEKRQITEWLAQLGDTKDLVFNEIFAFMDELGVADKRDLKTEETVIKIAAFLRGVYPEFNSAVVIPRVLLQIIPGFELRLHQTKKDISFTQSREMRQESFGYDSRIVQSGLLTKPVAQHLQLVHNRLLREFPEGVSRVVYPFSGSDLSNVLLATNAQEIVFIDDHSFYPDKEYSPEMQEQWKYSYFGMKKGIEDKRGETLDRYPSARDAFRRGYMKTYASSGWVPSSFYDILGGLYLPVVWELEALGATILAVDAIDEKVYKVEFEWSYPGGEPLKRTCYFAQANIAAPLVYPVELQKQLRQGFQVLFTKSIGNAPKNRGLAAIFESLFDEGIVVSDITFKEDFDASVVPRLVPINSDPDVERFLRENGQRYNVFGYTNRAGFFRKKSLLSLLADLDEFTDNFRSYLEDSDDSWLNPLISFNAMKEILSYLIKGFGSESIILQDYCRKQSVDPFYLKAIEIYLARFVTDPKKKIELLPQITIFKDVTDQMMQEEGITELKTISDVIIVYSAVMGKSRLHGLNYSLRQDYISYIAARYTGKEMSHNELRDLLEKGSLFGIEILLAPGLHDMKNYQEMLRISRDASETAA